MKTRDTKKKAQSKRLTVAQKLGVTAGSVAALSFAANSEADVVYVDNMPVSASLSNPFGTSESWDVDGDGGVDFELFNSSYYTSSSGSASRFFQRAANVMLGSRSSGYAALNGYGFVRHINNFGSIKALPDGFNVGPTLIGGYWSGYGNQWRSHPLLFSSRFSSTTSYYGNMFSGSTPPALASGLQYGGLMSGDNKIGFRFMDANADLHYGWAEINFDLTNGVVTINRWAYESDANTAIATGAIPEPTSSLLLLALGAAGLLNLRRRKKAFSENQVRP